MPSDLLKVLAKGEIRFVPREHQVGPRTVEWEVYDRAMASVPSHRYGTPVAQDHATEEAAQAECTRLEALR